MAKTIFLRIAVPFFVGAIFLWIGGPWVAVVVTVMTVAIPLALTRKG